MQNLIFLMNPTSKNWDTSSKAAKMCLNRLCIDEDAAFELSGVYYFEVSFLRTFYDYFYFAQKGNPSKYKASMLPLCLAEMINENS